MTTQTFIFLYLCYWFLSSAIYHDCHFTVLLTPSYHQQQSLTPDDISSRVSSSMGWHYNPRHQDIYKYTTLKFKFYYAQLYRERCTILLLYRFFWFSRYTRLSTFNWLSLKFNDTFVHTRLLDWRDAQARLVSPPPPILTSGDSDIHFSQHQTLDPLQQQQHGIHIIGTHLYNTGHKN